MWITLFSGVGRGSSRRVSNWAKLARASSSSSLAQHYYGRFS